MSSFVVVVNDRGLGDSYVDGSTYAFTDHGHLVVVRPDGRRRIYSPSGWKYVADVAPASVYDRRKTVR